MKRPIVLFDVNETLLDLRGLDNAFATIFGSADVRGDWFKQLLQLSLLANTLDDYVDFTTLGYRALEMVAAQRSRALRDEEFAAVKDGLRTLAPHSDVVPALTRLHDAGFRLATLTNSAPATVEAQIAYANMRPLFEQLLSVDAVRKYKPAPETYRYAAAQLGVPIGEIVLVAAHGWDVLGAARAGAVAAFVARPGQVLIPEAPAPAIIAPSMGEAVDQILARYER